MRRGAARAARRELAALAGLLSPAQKRPDGKSRPAAGISGGWCPHGGAVAGHGETAIAGHPLGGGAAQGRTWEAAMAARCGAVRHQRGAARRQRRSVAAAGGSKAPGAPCHKPRPATSSKGGQSPVLPPGVRPRCTQAGRGGCRGRGSSGAHEGSSPFHFLLALQRTFPVAAAATPHPRVAMATAAL